MEPPLFDGGRHGGVEHQMLLVATRQDDTLFAGQPAILLAAAEETLDLVAGTADGLRLAVLVDRTGDGEVLAHRDIREVGQDGDQLGHRGTVALHPAIALLEGDGAGEGQRDVACEGAGEEALQHHDALLLDRPAEIDIAFDVGHALPAG